MATSPLVSQRSTLRKGPTLLCTPPPAPRKPTTPPTGPLRLPADAHAVQCARGELHQQNTPVAPPRSPLHRVQFAWADIICCPTTAPSVDYLPCAQSCPSCGTAPQSLTWVTFMSPESTWKARCGTAGMLTICHSCQIQIDYFEGFHS